MAQSQKKPPGKTAKKKRIAWFVYMLECKGDRIYTGVTPDLATRYDKHCSGKGAKFTRSFPPKRILAVKKCRTRETAQSQEYALKQLARPDKLVWAKKWQWSAPG